MSTVSVKPLIIVIEQIYYISLIRKAATLILLVTQPLLPPNCCTLDRICCHRSQSSFISFLCLDCVFMIFYDHSHPVNNHLYFSIGPGM